jgi:hypothetical protein
MTESDKLWSTLNPSQFLMAIEMLDKLVGIGAPSTQGIDATPSQFTRVLPNTQILVGGSTFDCCVGSASVCLNVYFCSFQGDPYRIFNTITETTSLGCIVIVIGTQLCQGKFTFGIALKFFSALNNPLSRKQTQDIQ